MSLTQNEKICQVADETMVVGVDVGSETHYARCFDNRGVEFGKVFSFASDREGFEQFGARVSKLMADAGKTTVIVGAEPTGHYWFTFGEYLKKQGVRMVFVNPMHVKRTKELDDNRAGKSDRKDPKTIAQLMIQGRFLEPYIPEALYAELRVANNARIRITAEMVAIENQLKRWFSIYFPEYKTVFGDWACASSLIVLRNAPLPQDVVKIEAAGINALWREQKLRTVGMKRALRLCEAAKSSVGVTEGVNAAKCELEMLLDDCEVKQTQLEKVMMILETLVIQIPNAEKLLAIKGIGLLTVAGFFAEVGDLRRFKSPKQIQKLAGLAVAENSSGKWRGQTRISKRGRKLLRYTLFQAVNPLIRFQAGFADLHKYYTTRPNNPLKGKQSKVALCCKLIRVFWAIATKGKDFDSYTMMNDIKRNLPLAA
jgi:transposase